MMWFRTVLFYVTFVVSTTLWGTLSVLIAWAFPLHLRFRFIIGVWTTQALWCLRQICGIDVAVEGREHLPAEPGILLVKHQSTWETLWVQNLVGLQTTLVKKELMRIPFWGWAFSLLHPIAIDRSNPRTALRELIRLGRDRLDRGMWITLFPEGTRVPRGEQGTFYRGGAALASATGRPINVIAHNAGTFWPSTSLLKRPGTVRVRISPPFYPEGKKTSEINTLCSQWLEETMAELEGSDIEVNDR